MNNMTIFEVSISRGKGLWSTLHGPAKNAESAAKKALRIAKKGVKQNLHVSSVKVLAYCDWSVVR